MRDNKNGKLETHKGEHELRRGERLSEPAYKNLKIYDFLDILSSTSPMPGGGVVVALVAANAVNLSLKVINLSIGKIRIYKYTSMCGKNPI